MVSFLQKLLLYVPMVLRIAVPYLFGALGGLWSERAGVVNIALEGFLLAGAFAATIGAASGGTIAGVAAAVAVGAVLGLCFALLVVRGGGNAIVIGVALNWLADGATRFGLRAFYDSSSNSPRIDAWWATGPEGLYHPLLWLALGAVAATAWALTRTRFGLRVRAAGAAPAALAAGGIDTRNVQIVAVVCGSILAALGGAYLAWSAHQFNGGMSNGRGYIALAALVIGRWRPIPVALAAAGLGLAEAAEVALGASGVGLPSWVIQALPYVVTLVVLAGANFKRRA